MEGVESDMWVVLLATLLIGCRGPADEARERAALSEALARSQQDYLGSIEAENALDRRTLAWIDGGLANRSRTQFHSEARAFTERWARVYFVPREIHADLSRLELRAPEVRERHARILHALRARYFELHDFQRYCQGAAEADDHSFPIGSLPPQLIEFRRRLASRPPASADPLMAP